MFIVWERKSHGAKSRLGLRKADGCSSGSKVCSALLGSGLVQLLLLALPTKSSGVCPKGGQSSQFGKHKVGTIARWMFAFCHALVVHLPCGWSSSWSRVFFFSNCGRTEVSVSHQAPGTVICCSLSSDIYTFFSKCFRLKLRRLTNTLLCNLLSGLFFLTSPASPCRGVSCLLVVKQTMKH